MNIGDVANAVAPDAEQKIISIRPGEKLHEEMISPEDSYHTYEYADYYKILPAINGWSSDPNRIKGGVKVANGFRYASDTNSEWMEVSELESWIEKNRDKIGRI